MLLTAGTRLGPYEIVEPLGAGGMGEVYRARDTRLARIVAIKLLTGPVDHITRGRLLDEARSAAALNHPNICTIHEIADADDRLFIVMEHVDGRLLSEVAAEGAPIDTTIRYGIQITDALAHAHDRGIVHRDLKTANLMLTSDGRVKVLDFGIAQRFTDPAMDSATQMPTLAMGVAAGTLAYIAPEVLRGGIADRRSDIWAIGVVLYELLAGRRPFGGDTTFELSSAILRDALPPLPKSAPKPLRALVARCLEKQPSQRYQRAGEVRAALEMIAAGTAPAKSAGRSRTTTTAPRAARQKKAIGTGASRIRSIAVLPLDNLSRDPEQEYFADGITEALIGAVAQIEGLRVISRTSIMRFKGTQKSLPEIARELKVDGIITGSVRRVGDRVRISAQLIDPSDAHVWTANYDRDLHDALALESDIANAVADQIALKVSPSYQRGPERVRAVDPDVYVLCLRGRHLARQLTEAGLRGAIDCFEQAIRRDASYGPAWAGIADVHYFLGFLEVVEPREASEKGNAAALKAIELDPMNAEAHATLALLKSSFEWDWTAADREFDRASALAPNDANIAWRYGHYLANSARSAEGVSRCEMARRLDPIHPGPATTLAYINYLLGRDEESIRDARAALELEPNFALAHVNLAFAHLRAGRGDEALRHMEQAIASGGGLSIYSGFYAYACARSGRRAQAERVVGELEQRALTRPVSQGLLCLAHMALGNRGEALRLLELSYDQHDSMLASTADFDWWDPLRDTETFRDIVARMKFPGPVRRASAKAGADDRSIVVLPFENVSPDPDDAFLADGLTDEVIADLTKVGALRVISRTSAMTLKGARKDLPTVCRELKVRYALEGSVRRAGSNLRITAQLVDGASDTPLWSEKYSGTTEDVFDLQERLARRIVEALRVQLTPDEDRRVAARPIRNARAYDDYLRARQLNLLFTPDALQRARGLLERGLELEPESPALLASLGYVNWNLSNVGADADGSALAKARDCVDRALTRDPDSADGLTLKALLAQKETGIFASIPLLERAAAVQPTIDALIWLAVMSAEVGRTEQALASARRAVAVEPFGALINAGLGFIEVLVGDPSQAAPAVRRSVALDPADGVAAFFGGLASLHAGDTAEARTLLEHCVGLVSGENIWGVTANGFLAALSGDAESARRVAYSSMCEGLATSDEQFSWMLADVLAAAGDRDGALRWLGNAVRRGFVNYRFLAERDRLLAPLRDDPGFIELMAEARRFSEAFESGVQPTASTHRTSRAAASPRIQSLAVLPLENLSNDAEQEYFADGMTEALITDLAQIAGLRVISRTSVMRFKRTAKPLPEIARELGVERIVTGSVLRAGDRVRITTQLVDAPTDAHVWAHSYEQSMADVLALQREVASAVANEIHATTGGQTQRATQPRPVDPDVYTACLKGRHHWHRYTEPEMRKALAYFQAALERDPDYAPAHAGIAICHLGLGWLGAVTPHRAFPQSKAAALRALELDDSLAEAHCALAYVATFYEWNWKEARRRTSRALELQPGSADVHLFHAWYCNATGDHAAADAETRRALALDPLSPMCAGNVSYMAVFARRFDVAEQFGRQALDLDASSMARWGLGIALLCLRKHDEAIAELESVVRLSPGIPMLGWLGTAYALAGNRDGAREVLARLEGIPREHGARSTEIARILAALGDHDAALAALADACEAREGALGYIGSDPSWDEIADDDRFKAILRRMGLPGRSRSG